MVLIICSVPNATKHPAHMVCFVYYPRSGTPIFKREHFVSAIHRVEVSSSTHAFELRIPDLGFMRVDADEHCTTRIELKSPEWSLTATTTGRKAWVPGQSNSTPEGWLIRLPLPLHWHVHSFASPADFTLSVAALDLPEEDRAGKAMVHQEKNWANSFPAAHIWVQAHNSATDTSISLAGGKIMGMTAFLLGYRTPDLNVAFTPPFALSVLGLSLGMGVDIDWETRTFNIRVSGLWKRIEIKAQAPADGGWFGLASPFSDGHRHNFLTESFRAKVEVVVEERAQGWWGNWKEVRRETFDGASLEFGGEYFPHRGKKED